MVWRNRDRENVGDAEAHGVGITHNPGIELFQFGTQLGLVGQGFAGQLSLVRSTACVDAHNSDNSLALIYSL